MRGGRDCRAPRSRPRLRRPTFRVDPGPGSGYREHFHHRFEGCEEPRVFHHQRSREQPPGHDEGTDAGRLVHRAPPLTDELTLVTFRGLPKRPCIVSSPASLCRSALLRRVRRRCRPGASDRSSSGPARGWTGGRDRSGRIRGRGRRLPERPGAGGARGRLWHAASDSSRALAVGVLKCLERTEWHVAWHRLAGTFRRAVLSRPA